jgi:hypothetical protein
VERGKKPENLTPAKIIPPPNAYRLSSLEARQTRPWATELNAFGVKKCDQQTPKRATSKSVSEGHPR